LSVRVTAAVREPMAVGVKVTLMEQVLPAAREFPQLLLARVKSPAFAPERATEVKVTGAVPVLEMLKPCALLVELTFCEAKVSEFELVVIV